MAYHTQDDGFHEIQLNGKQLVFLFMAATVVSVVIFLCGVLVGRGVRAERGALADTEALSDQPTADAPPQPAAMAPGSPVSNVPPAASADSTLAVGAVPPPAVDDLTVKRPEQQNPATEALRPSSEKAAAPAREQKAAPAAADSRPAPPAKEPPPAAVPTAGAGYVVQVAALTARGEAEAFAKRLTTKGYAAYVMTPPTGTPSVFRVRVGSFKTKREADTIAQRLRKEEQLKPFVTH